MVEPAALTVAVKEGLRRIKDVATGRVAGLSDEQGLNSARGDALESRHFAHTLSDKTPEKTAGLIVAAVLNAAFFASITYGRSGDSVAAVATAINFVPFIIGPPLVLSFRPNTSRLRFYSAVVLIGIAPFSSLFFLAALIVSVLPQRGRVPTQEKRGKAEDEKSANTAMKSDLVRRENRTPALRKVRSAAKILGVSYVWPYLALRQFGVICDHIDPFFSELTKTQTFGLEPP